MNDPYEDLGRIAYDVGRASAAQVVPDTLIARAIRDAVLIEARSLHEGWKLWGPDGPVGPDGGAYFFSDRLYAWLCWLGMGEPPDTLLVQIVDPVEDNREIVKEGLGDEALYALLDRIAAEQRPWPKPAPQLEVIEGAAQAG